MIGVTRNKTILFNKIKKPIKLEKNRLVFRLDKMIKMYQTISFMKLFINQSKYEQTIVSWEKDKNKCYLCFNNKNNYCRLCGEPICHRCIRYVPINELITSKIKMFINPIIICNYRCFLICVKKHR